MLAAGWGAHGLFLGWGGPRKRREWTKALVPTKFLLPEHAPCTWQAECLLNHRGPLSNEKHYYFTNRESEAQREYMSGVHSQGMELRFLKTWEAPGLRRKVGSRSSYLANWSGVQASASMVGGVGVGLGPWPKFTASLAVLGMKPGRQLRRGPDPRQRDGFFDLSGDLPVRLPPRSPVPQIQRVPAHNHELK